MMTFDPSKRETTLRERGIDFAVDAQKVFGGLPALGDDWQARINADLRKGRKLKPTSV